ncbi:procollagen-lysine,2-oxoglutarate 5-dioxygenase 2-like isoform X2 [Mercenaria mercenaria]|uniref:procollagen-lysine,2-oxoglutarate 5-dioxygenase 2-like isoform X2 n=1 Tax=Mercenaria mercenaria TaxID=6596 RepID=UPI00234EF1F5|nr:procollagen-lysine,2-oxoglutarate 5-dioxygenase 2-like isoform X2 [Mercenaria mercenaria]
MARILQLLVLVSAMIPSFCVEKENQELLLVTIATEEKDGLRRYLRSTKKYDLDTKVFGLGTEWRGGDMTAQGGGHKINILKEELAQYKDREDLILMFTDSYDVVITAGASEVLEKFSKLDARVLFSAEGFCWPDSSLANTYPGVKLHEKRFLCSGGFIGYARDVYEIISHNAVADSDDDQLYYTKIFLDESLREKWNIKLDKRSEIFMNLHGALSDIMLKFKGQHSFLYNVKTGTVPIVIHGNGPIKPEFNRLANYLADSWTTSSGCSACEEDTISLEGLQDVDYPTILMGIFVEHPTPFLREALQKVAGLDYPKQKIDLLVHNKVKNHQKDVEPFVSQYGKLYKSVNTINAADSVSEKAARNWAVEECIKKDCQYFFNVDGEVHLDNDQTLKLLIQQNRSVLAPVMTRRGKAWSNFWGALSATGFYARSEDYMDIVHGDKIGLWNVPYMTGAYLVQGHVLPSMRNGYDSSSLDADMALCKTLREKGHFMFVTNRKEFGYLINCDEAQTGRLNIELWEIFNNPYDWEKRYIHPNYSHSLEETSVIEQPCPDVFWFPMMTEEFCDEMVAEMEYFDGWSGGKSEDPRLESGYESVPTDDIHMTQVGLQEHWLEVLKNYIVPLTLKVYPQFYDVDDPPRAILNFVVKYNPERQRELRPHHDSSTFTINIALNRPKIDYEGGGCRFLRYNCSVTDSRKGWMIMHPGRLTHFHEGLPTTKGTRYIFVSFVDP